MAKPLVVEIEFEKYEGASVDEIRHVFFRDKDISGDVTVRPHICPGAEAEEAELLFSQQIDLADKVTEWCSVNGAAENLVNCITFLDSKRLLDRRAVRERIGKEKV